MINRRQLLKTLTAVAGSVTATTLLSACSAESAKTFKDNPIKSNDRNGKVFSTTQLEALRHICKQTIPATSTPGAAEVNCHHFIDHQLQVVFTTDTQEQAVAVIEKIRKAGNQYGNGEFETLSAKEQLRLLTDLESVKAPFTSADNQAFKQIKALIVFGYYTSEAGATKELTYLPIPGGFRGSVPLSQVGSAYSSKAYY